MEVQLTPEQNAQLADIAARSGTAPERVVATLMTDYLDAESRFLAGADKGRSSAERGEFLEEDEMDAVFGALEEGDQDRSVHLATLNGELRERMASLDRGEHVEPDNARARLALRSEAMKRRA